MKKAYIIFILSILCTTNGYAQNRQTKPDETIFAFGGDIQQKFIQYVVDLTNKSNPKICYVPTASADNDENIKLWTYFCKNLSIEPNVLKVWISSGSTPQTFEEILLDMDAIVVGGGNTLNMIAIWKAQGIDKILLKALKKGIILAGGSAGSICWFENGISDSRPINLSVVDGLAFLPYSHCPHYAEPARQKLYHQQIKNGKMKQGYACDERAGILFKNGKFIETVSLNDVNHTYFVTLKNGVPDTQKLDSKILVNKNALKENSYTTTDIDKTLKNFSETKNQNTPLNAFISFNYNDRLKDVTDETKRNKILNMKINQVLIFNDSIAGIVNKAYDDFYGLWYFYQKDGQWISAGEDIGGDTVFESEITFRERAETILEKTKK